jgi:hypothetical protein
MRPFLGVVVDDGVIRCENGLVVHAALPKDIEVWDRVWVCYDFVHKCAVSIQPIRDCEEEPPGEGCDDDYDCCLAPGEEFWCSSTLF